MQAEIQNSVIYHYYRAEEHKLSEHKDPLHGVTLEQIVTELVQYYGWGTLGKIIKIRSFNNDPSIKSSLTFLRRTQWARQKVEKLYVSMKSKRRKAAE